MFYSQCLLSRKGPLGGVWVAAYCHKRLKKDQVTLTDIPFSVDKILLEGFPTITYRVLGYLLLGVVRIYSKKVEYLFDDCHEVLMNVKEVLVSKKNDAQEDSLRAPYSSITLPERFELDAFDFELIEDASGSNVLPREEIMLEDTWKDAGTQNCFLDEFAAVTVDLEIFSIIDAPAEDVPSPHLMDSSTAVCPSHTLSDLEADVYLERLRYDRFSEGNRLDFEMFGPMEEFPSLLEKIGKEHQTEEKVEVPEMELSEIAEEQAKTVHHNQRHSDAITEKLHDNRFFQGCEDFEMFCETEEEPPDLVRPSGGDDVDAEQAKDRPLCVTVDATPESKFPDASGAATPESMAIITPANKERVRTPSKRKCLLDNEIVLPNKVLRECIHDSSGLACKRMKAPHTVLDVWKACRIPKLPQDFLEPFTPSISLELRFLFRNKKFMAKNPVGKAEIPKKLDFPRALIVDRHSGETAFAPETPVQCSATKAPVKSPEKLDLPGSPVVGRFPERTTACSETPIQCSTSMGLFEANDITISDRVRPSLESVEKAPSLTENQEFDIDLLNEEMNSAEGDSRELIADGWSVRSRTVARYLRRCFLNKKRRREEGIVNLMQVLRGRTKNESARVFYEILVLKTKGLVDVKQDSAYADIIVKESPSLEENAGI